MASEETIENICQAFASVVDAKSPFTYRHSNGVAAAAVAMSHQLSLSERDTTFLRRAALLHDLGKLSVANSILEKPAALDNQEWDVVKQHPHYSYQVIRRIPGFADLSEVAASHHEKLDGSGYFRHLSAAQMSLPARVLVVADIFDALSAKRPYRDALPLENVFEMMRKDAPRALDPQCLEALMAATLGSQSTTSSLLSLSRSVEAGDIKSKPAQSHEIPAPANATSGR